ncbi:hypothetical protein AC1031_002422, partial [Aphanomyces cochlioides]
KSQQMRCTFKDCANQVHGGLYKCKFLKARKQCCMDGCLNIVYARNLCVRHGGKKKCTAPGCKSNAYGGDFSGQHGGIVSKRFCKFQGCSKQAHARGLCVRHGGGRICTIHDCSHHARDNGLCQKHIKRGGVHHDNDDRLSDASDVSVVLAEQIKVLDVVQPIGFGEIASQPLTTLDQMEFLHFLDEYFDVLPKPYATVPSAWNTTATENQPLYIL